MADYINDDMIVNFFRKYNSAFVLADLPSYMRSAAWRMINEKTKTVWEVSSSTQVYLIDGRGTKTIFCPRVPILALDSLVIIAPNSEETSYNVTQDDTARQILYDNETGAIEMVGVKEGIEYDSDQQAIFPDGKNNVRIVGQFGETGPTEILAMLQLYLCLKMLAGTNPSKYGKMNLVKERLGYYQYEMGKSGDGKDPLDSMIDMFYEALPKTNGIWLESV